MDKLNSLSEAKIRKELYGESFFQTFSWLYEIQRFFLYKISRLLGKLPGVSNFLNIPSKTYPSTREWCLDVKHSKSADYEQIYPARTIEIIPPNPYPSDLKRFLPTHTFLSEAFVAKFSHARVVGTSIISPDGKLLEDLSPEFDPRFSVINKPYNYSSMRKFKLPEPTIFSGRVAMLAIPYGGNYFHWLYDLLPRFHLIQQSSISVDSIDKFIINQIQKPFQELLLKALEIPRDKIIEVPRKERNRFHIQATELIVPSITTSCRLSIFGSVESWACTYLQGEFASRVIRQGFKGPKLIYISRKKAGRRKVINEDEVLALLEKYGFQSVCPEDYTIGEQVSLFQNARAVVSSHGAGLANIAFCPRGTKVIEFCSPEYLTRHLRDIAYFAGHDYHVFAGLALPGKRLKAKSLDIFVNLQELEAIVHKADIKMP